MRAYDESELIPTECLLRLSESDEDWIDYIYSKRYEDLHELVSVETLSEAIKGLTDLQKEALYMIVIRGHSTKEVAEMKGCNDRNIRKHRERAITSILKNFQAHSEE